MRVTFLSGGTDCSADARMYTPSLVGFEPWCCHLQSTKRGRHACWRPNHVSCIAACQGHVGHLLSCVWKTGVASDSRARLLDFMLELRGMSAAPLCTQKAPAGAHMQHGHATRMPACKVRPSFVIFQKFHLLKERGTKVMCSIPRRCAAFPRQCLYTPWSSQTSASCPTPARRPAFMPHLTWQVALPADTQIGPGRH